MTSHNCKSDGVDFPALRAHLAGQSGPRYWRSLEELAGTEEFQRFLLREFPNGAPQCADPASRRTFLKLMGASLALAGVNGCAAYEQSEKIVPYVRAPEQIVPGEPLYYATAISRAGCTVGVLAESHMGRPTMVEGNEKHPDSLGAIDPFTQASLLTLYDPDRSQVVSRRGGEISTWDIFLLDAVEALDAQRPNKGRGVRVLTESVTSPSLARLIHALREAFPEAKWHQYDPTGRASELGNVRYHLEKANVLLAFDADFLGEGPGCLRHAREFASRRETLNSMNRLYAIECTPTITGSMADHRLAVPANRVLDFAAFIAQELNVAGAPKPRVPLSDGEIRWARAVAGDLRANRGTSVVVAGEGQPALVHLLASSLNETLGNVGNTVVRTDPVEGEPVSPMESLHELVRASDSGGVEVLLILGGNPAYNAPADFAFAARLAKVKFTAHLSLYDDETSALCRWHIPAAHELEAWGDVRASDGTATIQQPLIAPLYGGRSAIEVLAALLKDPARSGYEIVRETWRHRLPEGQFETAWRTALHDGIVAGTALPTHTAALKETLAQATVPPAPNRDSLEIVFRPDPTIGDGRCANNGWLQELPKPLTKLTWENAAQISPGTADRLGLRSGDVIELRYKGRAVEAPVWVTPGHADNSVLVTLGYGRTRAGRVGTGAGFDAYRLRTSEAPWFDTGLEVHKTGRTQMLATTENHRNVQSRIDASRAEETRHLVRADTISKFRANPNFAREKEEDPAPEDSLYPAINGSVDRIDLLRGANAPAGAQGHAWGMVINLNTCIGCSACVVACQAENNIPIVGREEILVGREMQWIDVDRYYHGGIDNPEIYHQPRMCMHCENAPCEVVCPVGATVHDAEGINNMVYNRCVGTRYCSNNCPYKVRHFNFFHYSKTDSPSLDILNNPDVTVRARGVMEKCTYCIQRINAARYHAEGKGKAIADGDVITACQAACPTRAIVFGDINDRKSQVSQLKDDPRSYGMLTELNTRPRTTYIARLRNPNPELETERHDGV